MQSLHPRYPVLKVPAGSAAPICAAPFGEEIIYRRPLPSAILSFNLHISYIFYYRLYIYKRRSKKNGTSGDVPFLNTL